MKYLFETSWEVCNSLGGIYTVLSTSAKELCRLYGDGLCYIGPDVRMIYSPESADTVFSEEPTPLDEWRNISGIDSSLKIRTGRWNVPGRPMAILIDFRDFYGRLDQIFSDFWNCYHVDSLHAYGDYYEACAFAYAAGEVIASRFAYLSHIGQPEVTAHFHEWTTGMGLLYCKRYLSDVSTVFTTHATSIGRSICGNGKMLYAYMEGYHGDQMAAELNMQSKHSLEKAAAHIADCFTTVSDITARECEQLLEKKPDIVTPNGFEDDFVLPAQEAVTARKKARAKLIEVAEAVIGYTLAEDTMLLATAGRYEFHNKGLDAFIDSLNVLNHREDLQRNVVAYILVPGDVSAPRSEVLDNLSRLQSQEPLQSVYHPYNPHWMNNIENDRILNAIKGLQLLNSRESKVKVIFVPCYLHGDDGIFNMNYYDLLQGFDLTAFLSYYEPWGYTPLESIAYSIPTITTSLSGFGDWAKTLPGLTGGIESGVGVIERTDLNYSETVANAADIYLHFSKLNEFEVDRLRDGAREISRKALWSSFIRYYEDAFKKADSNNKPLNQIF